MQQVPMLSIVFMAVSAAIAFAIAVGLFLYYKIKKQADAMPFVIGAVVLVVFAMILEQLVHDAVLGGPAGERITASPVLYALYGGLMAALFEETGRFLAMKTVLRKSWWNDANALMYGAGHGGVEAVAILGGTMAGNISLSLLINSGGTEAILGALSGDALAEAQQAVAQLTATPSIQFLLGGIERIFAVILQIALSVLVWFAAKKKKTPLLVCAYLIHFLVDAITVFMSQSGVSVILVEVVIGIMAAAAAVFASRIYKTEREALPYETEEM